MGLGCWPCLKANQKRGSNYVPGAMVVVNGVSMCATCARALARNPDPPTKESNA